MGIRILFSKGTLLISTWVVISEGSTFWHLGCFRGQTARLHVLGGYFQSSHWLIREVHVLKSRPHLSVATLVRLSNKRPRTHQAHT